ncbi:uncharacterized protein B0I36DRAFT_321052 [Microdochium trichocladiopsis]|uniref:Uncharacterized protein n=1 Tax=Microdochium trichocladiopsis TaxID=1682393 RepID=A0A9P9BRS8_9PEZI|nr:uncharacterized protein B0I36DRAFT_321052 [Microdochium trichocladiopsis]KAH7033251.1 hypothetical protein B0I36DRAFT_321052 [Microdochium trichocladiopsis]
MVTPMRLGRALRATCTPRLIRPHPTYRSFTIGPRLSGQEGYGDSTGNPIAENPQKQPESNKAQESSEHPGPAPPDVGQGKKGSSGGSKTPEDASAASGGSRSKEAAETGSSPTGGSIRDGGANKGDGSPVATERGGEGLKGPQGDGTPQPSVRNQSIPGAKPGLTEEQKREVENHNVDFDKRHDRGGQAPDDLVDKKFWQGE